MSTQQTTFEFKVTVPNSLHYLQSLDVLGKNLANIWADFEEDKLENRTLDALCGKLPLVQYSCRGGFFRLTVHVSGTEKDQLEMLFKLNFSPSFDYGGEVVVKEDGKDTYDFFALAAVPKVSEYIIGFFEGMKFTENTGE